VSLEDIKVRLEDIEERLPFKAKARIETDIGPITTNATDIQLEITAINGTVATTHIPFTFSAFACL